MRRSSLALVALLLGGCGARSSGDLGARFDHAEEALVNQAQQTQAMGVQVGKVADKLAEVDLKIGRIELKLEPMVGAQVGIGNEMRQFKDEMRNELKAGRDAINTTIQYSKEMMEKDIANRAEERKQFVQTLLVLAVGAVISIGIAASVVLLIMRGSRNRAYAKAGLGHLVGLGKEKEI